MLWGVWGSGLTVSDRFRGSEVQQFCLQGSGNRLSKDDANQVPDPQTA